MSWPIVGLAALVFAVIAAVMLSSGRRVAVGADAHLVTVPTQIRSVARRSTALRLAGVAIGVVAGAAVWSTAWPNPLGLEGALAAPAFAGFLLAGVLLGEISGLAPNGPERTATLEVRSAWRYLPRFMTAAVLALGAVLALLLATTSGKGGAGDLTLTCEDGSAASAGPWPGAVYTAPIAASVLIGAGAAAFALNLVARRRRPSTGDAERAADDDARRASARAIIAACGVLVAAPLAATGLYTGAVMIANPCASPAVTAFGWTAVVLGPAASVAACWFTAIAVLPHRAPRR